jgi:hypothetical protein
MAVVPFWKCLMGHQFVRLPLSRRPGPYQLWHTDLKMWRFAAHWSQVDDRCIGRLQPLPDPHCRLRLTASAEDVVLAVQITLGTLPSERRRAGQPEPPALPGTCVRGKCAARVSVVDDRGRQLFGQEWAHFSRVWGRAPTIEN